MQFNYVRFILMSKLFNLNFHRKRFNQLISFFKSFNKYEKSISDKVLTSKEEIQIWDKKYIFQ